MQTQEEKLKQLLSYQPFDDGPGRQEVLEKRKRQAEAFVEIENGIAVLSDYLHARSYIWAGSFGRLIGIGHSPATISSAFEDEIFSCLLPEDLVERHVLELHYYRFMQSVPTDARQDYHTLCQIHFRLANGSVAPVLHRTCYLESLPNGSIWLALCLYTPCGLAGGQPCIVNHATGQAVNVADCGQCPPLLSPREVEVLALLARGCSSKQVARQLCIATNTVYRHRQNILAALQVSNTAMAVQIGIRLGLI